MTLIFRAVSWDPSAMHRAESAKPAGARYPANQDAIGIEIVGLVHGVTRPAGPDLAEPGLAELGLAELVCEAVTPEQSAAGVRVRQLKAKFQVSDTGAVRHPVVSWRNLTYASMAQG
ncbi:hypothetical protein [Comamonas serinivorans]|nr:hypothetical protein [Comamonas serinivorans]